MTITLVGPLFAALMIVGIFMAWVLTMDGGIDTPNPRNFGGLYLTILIVILAFCSTETKAADFPSPARVVDQPGLLSAAGKANIESLSAQHERATGNQVVLVIVNDLGGLVVEDYANKLFKQWHIGQKGTNNGVLLLVSMKEKKIRIEVGYGLEHVLPDAKAKRIINEMAPLLKAQKWDQGFMQGIVGITTSIRK